MNDNIIRDYEKAVHEISKAYYFINEDVSENIKQYPYFFIAGAGISAESVKTADQIIEECRSICSDKFYADTEESIKNQYIYWIKNAFPHKETRKKYIKNMLNGKKIPESAVKLANILLSRKVANLLVTPNFDTFVYDALKMFGEKNLLVAEMSESAEKLNIRSKNLNIMHVYGTYEFYDCCSLIDEKEEFLKGEADELFYVRSFLRTTLNKMSPIVIGYSGWEDDVIMTELKERLKMPLKYKMYWFCHTEEDYVHLPEWLKHREDVIFVMPKKHTVYNMQNDLENLISDSYLKADEVFSSFINEFNIKFPDIVQDPMNFLRSYFKENFSDNMFSNFIFLGFDEHIDDEKLCEVKKAIIEKNTAAVFEKIEEFEHEIEFHNENSIRTLMKYISIIAEESSAAGLNRNNLKKIIILYEKFYKGIEKTASDYDKIKLLKLLIEEIKFNDNYNSNRIKTNEGLNILNSINENSKEYREVYRELMCLKLMYEQEYDENLYNNIIDKVSKWNEIEDRKMLVKVYIKQAEYFIKKDRYEEAVKAIEETEKFSAYTYDKEWSEKIFIVCSLRKAQIFNDIGEYDKALKEIESLKTKYYRKGDLKFKHLFIEGFLLQGSILKKNMKLIEAEEVLNEIYINYRNDKDQNIRRIAVKSLLEKGEVLELDENFYEAIEVYNDIINNYNCDFDHEIRYAVAQARLNKIVIFTKNEKDEIIVKKCNEILNLYKNEKDEKIKLIIMQIILCKAIGLHNSGNQKEAVELYNNIIKVRKEDADIKIKSLIMEAKIFKSYCLKDNVSHIDTKEMCNEIISLCKSNDDRKVINTKAVETMLQQADMLIKSGDVDEGIKIYDEIETAYKDDVKIIKTIREFIQSAAKINFESANLIYEHLQNNCNDSSDEVKNEVLLAEFIILVNNKDTEFSRIEEYAERLYERSDRIKKEVEVILGNIGTDAYMNKKFKTAENYYYLLYKLNNDRCLNLAYMIRRGEVNNEEIYPDYEMLIENAVSQGSDMANINKALVLVHKERYDEALGYIRKVESIGAFEWWKHMDYEVEKYIVLFMGLVTGKINENEIDINDVVEKLEEFQKNDFVLQIERIIYLGRV